MAANGHANTLRATRYALNLTFCDHIARSKSAPHDALFRATFSSPENAAAELRRVLSPALVAKIDTASEQELDAWALRVLDASSIDELFQP